MSEIENIIVSDSLYQLTQVTMIVNVDGIHCVPIVIGNIAEEPFVVLTRWINKYFISTYETELYPVNHTSIVHSIGIQSLGNRYLPHNFTLNAYKDMWSFETLEKRLQSVELTNGNELQWKEYFDNLKAVKETNPAIQKAINLQNIIKGISWDEDDNRENYFKRILKMLHDNATDDKDTMSVLSYALKQAIEYEYI